MTYYCAACWEFIDPDWPGGICETCADDLTEEHQRLQEENR